MKMPLQLLWAFVLASCALTAQAGIRVQYFAGYGLYPPGSPDTASTTPGTGLLAANGSHRALVQLISAGTNNTNDGLDLDDPAGGYTGGDDVVLDSRILEAGVDGVDEWGYTAALPPPFVSTNSPALPLFVRVHQEDAPSIHSCWIHDTPLIWPDDLSSDIPNPPADVKATVIHIETGNETVPAAGVALDVIGAGSWFVATNGEDVAAGNNWATAKRTIQAALDAASSGDTVWVGPGIYQERLTISNGLHLASADGPRFTTIFGNEQGRCVTITHSNAVVSGFTITGGRSGFGGGVNMPAGSLIESCIVSNNGIYEHTASGGWSEGGGLYGGRARNCLIVSNFVDILATDRTPTCGAASRGGGAAHCTLENCTVVGNWTYAFASWGPAESKGGGGYQCTFVNSIAWNNLVNGRPESGGENTFDHTYTNDPRFLDSAYRLQAGSPCLDIGINQAWMGMAKDFDGKPRIAHGRVDLGAYERQVLNISPQGTNVSAAAAGGLSFEVAAEVDWMAMTNVPWLTIVSEDYGATNGAVRFDVAANETFFERTGAILVSDGELEWWYTVVQAAASHLNWYVATNGNDAADGANWATARRTIQAAVNGAVDGNTIWVSNGTYVGEIRIAKGVRIQSANGPAVTTIQGSASRCVTLSNAAAVVAGFTLTGGTADWGGGAYIDGGTLEDCVIRDNVASGRCSGCEYPGIDGHNPAFGGGVYGGILRRCIVSNNTAESGWIMPLSWAQGGGTYGADLYDCLVVDNRARSIHAESDEAVTAGGGTAAGTIVNCTVVGNLARVGVWALDPSRLVGGGSYNCALQNTVVYGNECSLADDVGWTDDVSGGTAFHSCAPDLSAENGNVANDPRFVDFAAGNFRLAADSPCVDAGGNEYVSGATDLDGNPRIVNDFVDMGAYERLAAGGIILIALPESTSVGDGATTELTLDVTANAAWTATTNVPWLAIASGESGTTNGTVAFAVAANDGGTVRTGAVIVTGGGLARTCTVVQGVFVPALAVAPTNVSVGMGGASGRTLGVTANAAWTATTNVPWLAIASGESGTTNGTVAFAVAANDGMSRTGAVIVAGGGMAQTCTVAQAAFVPTLDIYPASTSLASVAASGRAIDVLANVVWTATTNVSWLAITAGASGTNSGTATFAAAVNPGAARTGAVVLAGGGLTRTCTVVQAATPMLVVEPASTNLASAGGTGYAVTVTANLAWTATTTVPWLAIASGESGVNNGTVTFDAAANGGTARTGAVIVAGGGMSRTCTVVQFKNAALFVDWFVATNGNDAADGMSWATAKQTIQAAVDAAEACDTVWISNGVYATGGRAVYGGMTNRVAIDKPIAVQSVNGPATTILRGGVATRCAYVGTNATLSGFTLTNGAAWNVEFAEHERGKSGGGAWAESSGVLSNCVLSGNSAESYGGGAYGGTLRNCTLKGNTASWGGGAHGATLWDCAVSGNSVTIGGSGGGVNSCTANLCDISGNMADVSGGGGAFESTLNNCLVADNLALLGGGMYASTANSCTIVGNWAGSGFPGDGTGGGGSAEGTLVNCIVFGNGATAGSNYLGGAFQNSCTAPHPGGTGNISADPQFVDAGAGNYRLQAISPCLDAGDNGVVTWTEDLDGNPRIAFGAVDMGAYEAQLTEPGAWFGAITNGWTNDLDCAAGDGMPNLLKYATGGSPRVADDSGFVGGSGNGSWPILTFHRNPSAMDVRFVVESAERMASGAVWRGVATNLGGSWLGATNVEESGTGNPVECAVTDPVALDSNRFLRLRVSRP